MSGFHNADDVLREVRRRKLPPIFEQIWLDAIPSVLHSLCTKPRIFFRVHQELRALLPALSDLCPLWEENGAAVVGVLPSDKYVRFHYEDAGRHDPAKQIKFLGDNYQQFVTSLLVELEEAGLGERVGECAALLDYHHLEHLLGLLSNDDVENGDVENGDVENGDVTLAEFKASL